MTVCLQCAMEAMIAGTPYVPTREEPQVHQQRVHLLVACKARRAEMEQILAARVASGEFLMLGMNPLESESDDDES